jgi:hypothetical protein
MSLHNPVTLCKEVLQTCTSYCRAEERERIERLILGRPAIMGMSLALLRQSPLERRTSKQRDHFVRATVVTAMARVISPTRARLAAHKVMGQAAFWGADDAREALAGWHCDPQAGLQDVLSQARECKQTGANVGFNPGDVLRRTRDVPDEINCYNSHVYWAYRAAVISQAWLWNHWYTAPSSITDEVPRDARVGKYAALRHKDAVVAKVEEGALPRGATVFLSPTGSDYGHVVFMVTERECLTINTPGPDAVKDKLVRPLGEVLKMIEEDPERRRHWTVKCTPRAFWTYYPEAER